MGRHFTVSILLAFGSMGLFGACGAADDGTADDPYDTGVITSAEDVGGAEEALGADAEPDETHTACVSDSDCNGSGEKCAELPGGRQCFPTCGGPGEPCCAGYTCNGNASCIKATNLPEVQQVSVCQTRLPGATCYSSKECPSNYKCAYVEGFGRCLPTCGGVGEPCCLEETLVCRGSNECTQARDPICTPACGGSEEPCCLQTINNPTGCDKGLNCHSAGATSDEPGVCRPCGGRGQPCCPFQKCGSGLKCYRPRPVGYGTCL